MKPTWPSCTKGRSEPLGEKRMFYYFYYFNIDLWSINMFYRAGKFSTGTCNNLNIYDTFSLAHYWYILVLRYHECILLLYCNSGIVRIFKCIYSVEFSILKLIQLHKIDLYQLLVLQRKVRQKAFRVFEISSPSYEKFPGN
jgi:hypothetical protein